MSRNRKWLPPLSECLGLTHSLGGGLASAASVVSGFPAYTFNAAGLHEHTLYEWDGIHLKKDPLNNSIELYAGSLARYNNAWSLIDAYYVDHDILSFVQDEMMMPSELGYAAIGTRHEMDGPHDVAGAVGTLLPEISVANPAALAMAFNGIEMIQAHRINET